MHASFIIMVGDKYVGSTGTGNLEFFDSIEQAEKLRSYAEAFIVASHWLLGDWKIIEVAPDHPGRYEMALS